MTEKPWYTLLRLARLNQRWLQADLAERLNADVGTVSRWERGTHVPERYYQRELRKLFPTIDFRFPLPDRGPPPIWNVPYERNLHFTGRDEVLEKLHMTFQSDAPAPIAQALRGLGGIGKSQTASEYAYRYSDEYDAVLWVRATREHYAADLSALARLLQLPGAQQEQQDEQALIRAICRWLRKYAGWLLILDSVEEGVHVGELLSVTGTGHILFTTRSQAIADRADNIELTGLTPEDGALLLLRVAHLITPPALLNGVSSTDQAVAMKLARLMEGLPLALELAGVYIRANSYTLVRYQEEYLHEQVRRIQMLSYTYPWPRSYSDYPESVATTWSLSFRRVREQDPAAVDLLEFCAYLSPDAIPESLLLQGASALTPLLHTLEANVEALNRTLVPLLNYSLLRRHADSKLLSIHRLVQEVVRCDLSDLLDLAGLPATEQERLRREHQRQWAKRTVAAVALVFSAAEYGSIKDFDGYIPHVLACTDLIEGKGLLDGKELIEEAASLLLLDAGSYWRRHGWYQQAVSFCQRALKMDEEVCGLEHPKTMKDRGMLGLIYDDMGQHTLAEQCHQDALAPYNQRSDLAMHPDRARYLMNLATCYYLQEKRDQAEPLFKEALAIFARVLGPEHYATLEALTWLATIDRDRGRYAEAEARYEQALAVYERQLPARQEVLAACLDNLAAMYDREGQFERATTLRQRALTVLQQSLGTDHPDVAHCLTNLADTYTELEEYKQAEAYSKQALAIYERDGEEVHPDSAWQICRLATLAARRHHESEAETLFQRALTMIEQNWGLGHQDLVRVRASYAAFLRGLGRVDEAISLEERVCATQAKSEGAAPPE